MIQPLTFEETKAGLEALADEFPGRVADCKYAIGGKPHCILGHLLHRAGVPVEALIRLDDWVSEDLGQYFEREDKALLLASEAQGYQDHMETWRVAVDTALAECTS